MTNRRTLDMGTVMDTINSSFKGYNMSAPAEVRITEQDEIKLSNDVLSMINSNNVTLDELCSAIMTIITNHTQDKLGIGEIEFQVSEIINDGTLHQLAVGSCEYGNQTLHERGFDLNMFSGEEVYRKFIEELNGVKVITMRDLNEMSSSIICQMVEDIINRYQAF